MGWQWMGAMNSCIVWRALGGGMYDYMWHLGVQNGQQRKKRLHYGCMGGVYEEWPEYNQHLHN
jgi:hypothetical protein